MIPTDEQETECIAGKTHFHVQGKIQSVVISVVRASGFFIILVTFWTREDILAVVESGMATDLLHGMRPALARKGLRVPFALVRAGEREPGVCFVAACAWSWRAF